MKHYNLHILMKMGQSAPNVASTAIFILNVLNYVNLKGIVEVENGLITRSVSPIHANLQTMTAGTYSQVVPPISSSSARNWMALVISVNWLKCGLFCWVVSQHANITSHLHGRNVRPWTVFLQVPTIWSGRDTHPHTWHTCPHMAGQCRNTATHVDTHKVTEQVQD